MSLCGFVRLYALATCVATFPGAKRPEACLDQPDQEPAHLDEAEADDTSGLEKEGNGEEDGQWEEECEEGAGVWEGEGEETWDGCWDEGEWDEKWNGAWEQACCEWEGDEEWLEADIDGEPWEGDPADLDGEPCTASFIGD